MKQLYGVLFESPAQRDELLALLKALRLNAHSVEVLEPSIIQEYNKHMEQMMDVIEPVRKHKRDLERAERAFSDDPTPRLAAAIKQLKVAVRREEKKMAVRRG